ncbi:transcription initiation protein [Nocardia cyriacigeorgica]|uniref:YciI family protein n=1 Tax=Nocardia cyriacigeorgica TaxID=135487 RepID=UPI001895C7B2|nr:YciI family protein [Nocardia cyriacigeorgica]MBF6319097.1 transcription initiation protein [Nocardia cyriacigeorgica]MBF6345177.1 transcription initiation protein [Nocardia cyriacigeorgica]MBF6513705.1 transcription initiation protein [Nocardia cyriacigeorgica]MBF6531392.1 transcription initiation protein [Nocardia cyriacigeorgica]
MQYLALLVGRDDDPEAAPGSAEFDAEVQRYAEFEERVAAAIAGGAALYPSSTAVNVTRDGDTTLITDGPFAEGAEVVGGFYVFEVTDLDEAIGLARQVPAVETGAIELRPMVQWTPHDTPGADWWMALLWDRADTVIAPGTPEWEAALAEHQRFAERVGAAIRGGGALRPPSSATTLRMREGELSITDGPFGETAEVVDGLYLFAAPDRRTASEIAAQIPLGAKGRTELRQIVDLGQ